MATGRVSDLKRVAGNSVDRSKLLPLVSIEALSAPFDLLHPVDPVTIDRMAAAAAGTMIKADRRTGEHELYPAPTSPAPPVHNRALNSLQLIANSVCLEHSHSPCIAPNDVSCAI